MSYFYAIIETFQPQGEFSHNSIRARPVEGQGLSTNMRVECSTAMRQKYPVGTKIKIRAQLKHTGSGPHLYTYFKWTYEVVTDQQANEFIQGINK
jgi:hypothetical protein